ncbi:hypothetical protein [Denitrobaculum tricleocarpae]|uniref:DUF465 domain-containing protein n=1 Tax=Denitrobaculum tricleocarpae TaxID=2591009 RepID=A0A545U2T3_9PROT|nr:hypothetical protein [Denitrobaculum tricleocarpae]TQV83781.1 hypothetical protein FKG95_04150 [Denitrobaculum tricleocarpae]
MAATVDDRVTSARTALLDAKATLTREIRNYPTPISDCDSEFKHLLARRIQITAALKALELEA